MLYPLHKLFRICLLVLLGLIGSTVFADEIHTAAEISRDGVTLSVIAGQPFVFVQDRRTLELQAGVNRITFDNIPTGILPEAMRLDVIDGAEDITVVERQYRYDLSPGTLLSNALNQTVTIQKSFSNPPTAPIEITGMLIDFRLVGNFYDVTLRLDDGAIRVLTGVTMDGIIFNPLTEDAAYNPLVDWIIEVETAGVYTLEFSYLSSDFAFNTEYSVLLAPDNETVDITGWLTLTGKSRVNYTDVQIQFVSGQWLSSGTAAGVTQLYDYTIQRLPQRLTIPAYSSRQVSFMELEDIPVARRYVYNASPATMNQPLQAESGQATTSTVEVYLEILTTPEQIALMPSGRVRVYAKTATDDRLFMRSTNFTGGSPVRFRIGNDLELSGKRTQTFFEVVEGESITEALEITVQNDKTVPVTVDIRENLVRIPGLWRIQDSSREYTTNANTITYTVTLAPGEATTVTYNVRYAWPIGNFPTTTAGAGGGSYNLGASD